jgi:hypothetical protein
MNKDQFHGQNPSTGEQHQNSKFWRGAAISALVVSTALLGDVVYNPNSFVGKAVADSTVSLLGQLGIEVAPSIPEDFLDQTSVGN